MSVNDLAGRIRVLLPLVSAALLVSTSASAFAQTPAAQIASSNNGALVGVTIRVSNLQQALRFWHDGLGLTVGMQLGPPDRRKTILTFRDPRQGNILLLSDETSKAKVPLVRGTLFYQLVLRFPDLSAIASRLNRLGFTVGEPHAGANGYRTLIVTSPDQVRIELVETSEK